MSITAVWTVMGPGGATGGGRMSVASSTDVARLIDELSKPGATAAMLRHEARAVLPDGRGGNVPDHDMTIGVRRGFGYLSYTDADHDYMVLDGATNSPEYLAHYVDYPAGSGVPLEQVRSALIEFLATSRRPSNVGWKTDF